jgi:glycosyltransferase involved in cell wall biosynthesis
VRVLAFNPVGFLGGAERSLLEVLAGLVGRGHSVSLAIPTNGPLEEAAVAAGVQCLEWRMPVAVRYVGRYARPWLLTVSLFSSVTCVLSLLRIVLRLRPDVVYSNGVKSHIITALARLLTPFALVWHIRDFVSGRGFAPLLFFLARRAVSHVIANSRAVAAEWQAQGISTSVVYSGFTPWPGNCSASPNPPGLRLLATGIFAPWKGIDVILKTCDRLPADLQWTLTICGDEVYETAGHAGERARLQDLARSLGLDGKVTFAGMVRHTMPYLQNADIFLHASVRDEPFGRVVAEAMAAGVPVIASRSGGVPEIVRDGVDGLLYPMGDMEALSKAITDLASDPERRESMGRSGRERMSADFPPEKTIDAVEAVFASAFLHGTETHA